ncbi:hypothetical protein HUW51_00095 (plasmid) [Adhaeribacter swui]|uniref:Uncharacterized protein n=1 Tax=Adhaeribacter swui TaxID=2086471 RepID=A0A7G7G208_9BACT|nr:hypothetical protein [Adhaeribacter swui]QNF31192.1 hypothetical protein HUW51_00095 [Adhaeribacter swui]
MKSNFLHLFLIAYTLFFLGSLLEMDPEERALNYEMESHEYTISEGSDGFNLTVEEEPGEKAFAKKFILTAIASSAYQLSREGYSSFLVYEGPPPRKPKRLYISYSKLII